MALLWLAACAGGAGAQGTYGQFEVQYQHDESPDGERTSWAETVNLSHATRLGPSVQLIGQASLRSVRYLTTSERSLRPDLSVRAVSPFWGVSAFYRPLRNTDIRSVDSRQDEYQFAGYLSRPHLPRLDVDWVRRRSETEGATVQPIAAVTRNARLSWTVGRLDLRGGLGDISLGEGSADPARVDAALQVQRNAGASFRILSRPNASLETRYDFNQVERGRRAEERSLSRNHRADVTGSWRPAPRLGLAGSFVLQSSVARDGVETSLTTREGSILANYQPRRSTSLALIAGVRPGAGALAERTLRYVTGSATLQGRVRGGWTGQASATQTVNWDGSSWVVGSYRAGSRFVPFHGMDLTTDLNVSANGDTAVRAQRVSSQALVAAHAQPLRTVQLGYTWTGYRAGPDLGRAAVHTTTRAFDVRVRLSGRLDWSGNFARAGQLTGGPATRTTRMAVRWSPSSRFEATGDLVRNSDRRTEGTATDLAGRNIWTGRVLAGLGPRWRLRLRASVADPGKPTRTRQYEAALSTRLGGPS